MFLTKEDLRSAIYEYQVDQITEDDTSIVDMAISTAMEEMYSYLSAKYDIELIFAQEGQDRNPLILSQLKTIAVWHLIQLANVDMIYERAKERYDRVIDWLKKCASGALNPNLPPMTSDGEPVSSTKWGSMPKNTNDY